VDIGEEDGAIIVEPLEDPFERPSETPVEKPAAPVENPDRELIPA
jgi:hypothetical protein